MKYKLILITLILGAINLNSCSDDVVTPPPDPCAGATRTSANFTMKEIILDSLRYDTDTVIVGNYVEFTAVQDADEYYWTMSGTDQTWTTKSFKLRYLDFPLHVFVTLVVKRNTPNIACFPDDKQYDTVTKQLVVDDYARIFGIYRGVSTINPKDTFDVTIKRFGVFPRDLRGIGIINLVNGCVDTTIMTMKYDNRILGYRQFWFRSSQTLEEDCLLPDGLAELSPDDNHLLVNYVLRDTTYPRYTSPRKIKPYTFRGVRQ